MVPIASSLLSARESRRPLLPRLARQHGSRPAARAPALQRRLVWRRCMQPPIRQQTRAAPSLRSTSTSPTTGGSCHRQPVTPPVCPFFTPSKQCRATVTESAAATLCLPRKSRPVQRGHPYPAAPVLPHPSVRPVQARCRGRAACCSAAAAALPKSSLWRVQADILPVQVHGWLYALRCPR